MRKLLIISLVLLLCASAFAIPRSEARNDRGQFTGPRASNSQDGNIFSSLAFTNAGLGTLSTGKIWYFDSNAGGNATGTSWTNACLTLNAAIDLSDADGGDNRGDYVVGAPGHTEDVTAASVFADVPGMTIKGFGTGSLKPQFVWEVATGTFVVSSHSVILDNLRFVPSVTEVVSGVVFSADSDFSIIRNCDFGYAELSGTDEFDTALSIASLAKDITVEDCFFHAEAAGAGEAIYIGAVSGVSMKNLEIFGDYATGCIVNVGAADDVRLVRSLLFNGTMHGDGEINTVAAMSMAEGTGGYIGDNRFVSHAAGSSIAIRIGDDMVFMNNMINDLDGDEFSGGLESGSDTVTVTPVTGT